jgi:hypothetical protein
VELASSVFAHIRGGGLGLARWSCRVPTNQARRVTENETKQRFNHDETGQRFAADAVRSSRTGGPALSALKADESTRLEVGARKNGVLLHRLLAMAQGYRDGGDVRTAMDLYWLLAEEHQETREAVTAKEVLLEMAAGFERRRAPHMARSIYERLVTGETR